MIEKGSIVVADRDLTSQELFSEGGAKIIVAAGTKGKVARAWGVPKYPLADVQFEGLPGLLVVDTNWLALYVEVDFAALETRLATGE